MDTSEVKKVASYLKGLAETRARAVGDVEHYRKLLDSIGRKLGEAQSVLDSCDFLIKKYDSRLDPTKIDPIRGWKGRYGKRGALRKAVAEFVQAAAPEPVSTLDVSLFIQQTFHLEFATPTHARDWKDDSLLRVLNFWIQKGLIERLHAERKLGSWRWIGAKNLTLDRISALANKRGVAVTHATVEVETEQPEEDQLPC